MSVLTLPQLVAEMALQTATIDAECKVVERAMEQRLAVEAKSRAPVLTGALQASIVADDDGVGPTVPYGGFVEYGTSDTPPQPYMGPAADAVTPLFAVSIQQAGVF